MKDLLPRGIDAVLADRLATRRVVVIGGPRQAGKTTLARQLLDRLGHGTLQRLDDEPTLSFAREDPRAFVATGERPVVIDEVQRGGDTLVRAIKAMVDGDDSPGQFVLTGSSNFLTVPTLSESLAGRATLIELGPFTQGELAARPERFVEAVFDDPGSLRTLRPSELSAVDYFVRACAGGFPEAQRLSATDRSAWFHDYVATILRRDIVEMSGIRKVRETEELLRLFAARTGGELVMQSVITAAPLERAAVYDRLAWLETTYLIRRVPAWSRSPARRVKRHPKLYVTDSGLAAWLVRREPEALIKYDEPMAGPLLETFVVDEILRQATWARGVAPELSHYRDRSGREVDLILERPDGAVVAIEVKKTSSPTRRAARWLDFLAERLGDRFSHGVLLHTGPDVIPFGERLTALPIDALWRA